MSMKKHLYFPLSVPVLALLLFAYACKKEDAKPAPTLTGISQTTAMPGSSLMLTGMNFDLTLANNVVTIGTTTATVTAATATQITFTVPATITPGQYPVTLTI